MPEPIPPIIIPPIDPTPIFSRLPTWLRPVAQQLLQAVILALIAMYAAKQAAAPVTEKIDQGNDELRQQNKTLKAQLTLHEAEAAYWSIPVTGTRNNP